ncbi:TPA: hypothetical protein DCE37_07615 [Candidatus Latescibacteria bacterium]|nr:hypothetical protein [Candidatus Latescibacterota bacterium]
MTISDLICEVYRWPRPNQIANGSMTYGDGVMLLLRVLADDGLEGRGWQGGTAAERPLEIFTPYIDYYRDRLVGKDPENSAEIFAAFEHEHIKTFGFGGAHCQLTGAVNCALWDLRGQHAGKPVHALLSGDDSSKKVRGYIAGGYYYGDDGSEAGLSRLQEELSANISDLGAKSRQDQDRRPDSGHRCRHEARRCIERGDRSRNRVDGRCQLRLQRRRHVHRLCESLRVLQHLLVRGTLPAGHVRSAPGLP